MISEAENPPLHTVDNRLSGSAIEIIAQSLQWSPSLTESATTALALDAEYRIREIVQDSIKYMKHSKRSCLTPHDINAALRLRDVPPVYGFTGRFAKLKHADIPNPNTPLNTLYQSPNHKPPPFHPVEGTDSLFYTQDNQLSVLGLLQPKPKKLPIRTTISAHWLAVDSVQPTTNQNPGKLLHHTHKKSDDKTKRTTSNPEAVEIKLLVKHDLSLELHLYYEQITRAVTAPDMQHLETCLSSIKIQTGLEQMLPYLSQFIYRTVRKSTQHLPVLFSTMRLTNAILCNPAFNVEPYLQQLLPAVVTCIVGKRLCSDPWENHWALREYASSIASTIFEKFGKTYLTLQPRFTRTLDGALQDLKRPLTTHYGAIVGLASLKSQVIKLYLLPKLNGYTNKLRPLLSNPAVKPVRRLEASKVVGAILWAAPIALAARSPQSNETDSDTANVKAVLEDLRGFEATLKQELKERAYPYGENLSESQIGEFLHHHKRLELDRNSKKS